MGSFADETAPLVDRWWIWFVGAWIILGVYALILMFGSRDVERKRAFLPKYMVAVWVLFNACAFTLEPDLFTSVVLAVMSAVIFWVNYQKVRICSNCGRTSMGGAFHAAKQCAECGASLDATSEARSGITPR